MTISPIDSLHLPKSFGFEMFGIDWISDQEIIPSLVGIIATLAVFGLTSLLISWRMSARARNRAGGEPIVLDAEELEWDKPTSGVADRRTSIRREGVSVNVFVTSAVYGGVMHTGQVLDRSTGGLRLSVKHALPEGASIQVKTQNAPDTTPWSHLTVRSCKEVGSHFELGCAFDETPPWNILLLFG